MVNQQHLKRDIETLHETINICWHELSQAIQTEERICIRKQLSYYHDELMLLITQIL